MDQISDCISAFQSCKKILYFLVVVTKLSKEVHIKKKKLTLKNFSFNLTCTKSQNIKEFIHFLLEVNIKPALLVDG